MIEQDVKVALNKRVGPDTFLLGFRSHEIAEKSRPGQFTMLRIGSGIDPLLRRPFSICNIQEGDLVCMLYRIVGRGTTILSETREGEILSVIGPLGRGFELPERDGKLLLIAGGIGIAPLFFLAQSLKSRDMEFMVGFTSSSEIIDSAQIGGLAIKMSLATDDGTEGYAGTVTDLLKEYLDKKPDKKRPVYLYACGPLQMLKAVVSISNNSNSPCQVSMEAAMACGLGACQGCAVKAFSQEREARYYRVCKDGPVFPADDIDWNSL